MTPLESFINYKSDTTMQCGSYHIDLPKLKEGEQYRFHFDMSACIGCRCCEVACNEQNANPADVKWRRVGEMESGVFPDVKKLFNSMSCNHCIDPECLKGCPTSSYIKLENGVVFHKDDSCIGCQYCTWNCPYEVPVFNPDRKIVTKCDMCYEKLELNQTPACVQACPAGAIEIEVVDKDEWLKNDIKSEGVAPHLPDIDITKPTTRYTLLEPNTTVKPADEHILKPSHAELPLVFMTLLTQISVGGFLALFITSHLNFFSILVIFLLSVFGLLLSALHLGRPFLAITAMKNIKTSWLSREALALGIYTFGVAFVGGLLLLGYEGIFIKVLQIGVLVVGIYGIFAQSMIYRVKARPSWDRSSTNYKFFGSGYVGFLLIAIMLPADQIVLFLALVIGIYQIFTIYKEKNFYKYLDKNHTNYYQLSRTKKLLEERFATLLKIRLLTLVTSALILPFFALVFNQNIAFIVLILSLVGALVSELIGRYLFYTTVVPLGLAGNFFVGNQR